jgi:hypothetical protein
MTNMQNASIGTKEGWSSIVHAAPRTPPNRLTPRQLTALSAAEKKRYDMQRRDWHANMGVLRTPQFQELQDGLWNILDSNVQDGDRVKGAIAVEGSAGLGKSTAVEQFAKDFHLREICDHGAMTDAGHERWPVCRVTLSGHPTMRDLNLSLLHFFAHPGVRRGNAADFARRALDTFLACDTRLLIVDDVHFLNLRAADGVKVSNHLKFIANEFPVTIILVGIGLTAAGLFSEGGFERDSTVAQTGRRTTKFTVERFEVKSADGRKQWRAVLHSIEKRVVLTQHEDGTLPGDLRDYLYERSQGHIGSLMTLVNRATSLAIRSGAEALTTEVFEKTTTDVAAEAARKQQEAALRAMHRKTRTEEHTKDHEPSRPD